MPSWSESLAVGHATIDAQHRALFAHADRLLEAMRERRAPAEVEALLGFLRDYCREHFAVEEGLMAAQVYPQREAHLAQHRDFRRRFAALEEQVAAKGVTPTVVLEVKDLVRGWLVNHVGTTDLALADFLPGAPSTVSEAAARTPSPRRRRTGDGRGG